MKTWLAATAIWLTSADGEEKGCRISPRPCQGASVSNCSENVNANKVNGFGYFLFLLSACKAPVLRGQGLSKNTGEKEVKQFIMQGVEGGRVARESRHNRVTSEITQSVSLSHHPPFFLFSPLLLSFPPLSLSIFSPDICFCFASSHGTNPGFIILSFAEHELVFTPI